MTEDVVRSLGLLCLGSRLKRIGERLQANTDAILAAEGVGISASQYPYLASLDRLGPLTIGELAEAVGVSQPGVTRSVNMLIGAGLMLAESSPDDQRRRIVRLTADGARIVEIGKRSVWARVEAAVADLCEGFDGPLLAQLAAIEEGLDAAPLVRRGTLKTEQDTTS
ncbi:DNA-binding transcriptional repressor MarR [Hartmannibacter diazotrophicus]|uniref:DNA-binding transcriptional repressor MarR n=1 Tax=Hartmannibacter diazotrophicus TaxID=1482074 RepID=A0A2C9DC52_9HYPH|nr:MarR family transcriptional regulator [Hartmannibacter diazotrophicus]SON57301.1 DNA-binding transcriptional repressor MarR [Hartmannibacter diazotrophicus]